MNDLKRAIYNIEHCLGHVPEACATCPHHGRNDALGCMEELLGDALALLKKQESEPVSHDGAPVITLRQLVQYFYGTGARIQICDPDGCDWNNYTEFDAGSAFLDPFVDYEIKDIGTEKDDAGEPIIRVDLIISEDKKT